MSSIGTEAQTEMPSSVHTVDTPYGRATPHLAKEELDGVLRALEIPFDADLVQWRVTEWSEDGTRGLMMPYADPRAYSDRLNNLFTPAGWTRRYTVQTSAPVQRSKRGAAAKILVTCEVTIACIGTNSGTGEEWSDKENALTGAEAQAFKRTLSCFGLGRYLYDMDGEWIELDQQGVPKKIPRLPRWATPKGWLAGLRPKPRRNRRALVRANGHSGNGEFATHGVNGNGNGNNQTLVAEIETMEKRIGKRLYRGLLKRVARAWSPQQIGATVVLQQVLAQMQGAERGVARLEAARARLAPEVADKIIASLNTPPAKLEDLQSLHTLVVALEREVDSLQT
jgi:Rad52/22 family double-strand break repair protein